MSCNKNKCQKSKRSNMCPIAPTCGNSNLPKLHLSVTPSPSSVSMSGEIVTHTYKVSNSGSSEFNEQIRLSDISGRQLFDLVIPANGSKTFTTKYSVNPSDINNGGITNNARIYINDGGGWKLVDSASSRLVVNASQVSGLLQLTQNGRLVNGTLTVSNSSFSNVGKNVSLYLSGGMFPRQVPGSFKITRITGGGKASYDASSNIILFNAATVNYQTPHIVNFEFAPSSSGRYQYSGVLQVESLNVTVNPEVEDFVDVRL